MGSAPLYVVVIAVSLILTWLCFVRSPRHFIHFYFLFRPLVQPFAYNQYKLMFLPLTGIFPVILICYVFLLTIFSRQRTFLVKNSLFLYIMLYFFLMSSFFSLSFFDTIAWSLKFLTGIMTFILVYNNIRSDKDFFLLIKSFICCSIAPMIFGYYQYLTETGGAWKGAYYTGKRIESFFGEFNAYGEFLCILICAALILVSIEKNKSKRIAVALVLVSLITSLVLSLNRGSWIALGFGLSVSAVIFYKHISMRWLVIAFTCVSLAAAPIAIKRFQELDVKTEYGSKNTLEGRVNHWHTIFDLVIERPLLGYGPGMSAKVLEKRLGESSIPPHNDYLLLWFECGIFTTLAYILFLAANTLFFLTRHNKLGIINYALSVLCLYFMLISFFQNIIMNVTVFPMFLAMISAGLKLNTLSESPAHSCGK